MQVPRCLSACQLQGFSRTRSCSSPSSKKTVQRARAFFTPFRNINSNSVAYCQDKSHIGTTAASNSNTRIGAAGHLGVEDISNVAGKDQSMGPGGGSPSTSSSSSPFQDVKQRFVQVTLQLGENLRSQIWSTGRRETTTNHNSLLLNFNNSPTCNTRAFSTSSGDGGGGWFFGSFTQNFVQCQSGSSGGSSSRSGAEKSYSSVQAARKARGLSPTAGRHGRMAGWSAAFGRKPSVNERQGAYNALRLGLAQLEGNVYSEDRLSFDEIFVDGSSLFLLSVFDGHGGWQVAHYLERELLSAVREKFGIPSSSTSSGSLLSKSVGARAGTAAESTAGTPVKTNPKFDRKRSEKALYETLKSERKMPSTQDPNRIATVLTSCYKEVDEKLRLKIQETVQLGFDRFVRLGSCACTVAVTDAHVIVANTGDCKAILGKKRVKHAIALNRVHNSNEVDERARIRRERPNEPDAVRCAMRAWRDPITDLLYEDPGPGRELYETGCYVKGVLQPTRAFGDFALKRADMNVALKAINVEQSKPNSTAQYIAQQNEYASPVVDNADFSLGPYITSEPEIKIFERDLEDEIIVVGSDGLFDFLEDDDILEICRAAGNPEVAAGALTEAVKWQSLQETGLSEKEYEALPVVDRRDVHDDVTVGVFFLQFPEVWRYRFNQLSEQLQEICDVTIANETDSNDQNLVSLGFSVCVADPLLTDCPLVAVSKGFEKLTGYRVEDAIGRNCRFLSYGVPHDLRDEETTERLRAFTNVATSGDPFATASFSVRPPDWAATIPGGGAYFCRWNRRRDGSFFQNLFVLRQIWIGDRTFIIALQTELPKSVELDNTQSPIGNNLLSRMNYMCDSLAKNIREKMPGLEMSLTPSVNEDSRGWGPELREAMKKFKRTSSR